MAGKLWNGEPLRIVSVAFEGRMGKCNGAENGGVAWGMREFLRQRSGMLCLFAQRTPGGIEQMPRLVLGRIDAMFYWHPTGEEANRVRIVHVSLDRPKIDGCSYIVESVIAEFLKDWGVQNTLSLKCSDEKKLNVSIALARANETLYA